MKLSLLKELKIPTIIGLGIITLGIIAGVFLVVKDKVFITHAFPDLTPKNITISNISDSSATISWETEGQTIGFVTYGQTSSDENPARDERDNKNPLPHNVHYVVIRKLTPKTTYKYKVISGSSKSEEKTFSTSNPQTANSQKPIIGTVVSDNTPIDEGIAYLNIFGATIQSALIKTKGGFLIPLNNILSTDTNESFTVTDDSIAKIDVVSGKGNATISFRISQDQNLPIIKLGETIDLTLNQDAEVDNQIPEPTQDPNDFVVFDLNADGEINAADNAIILNNFGKNPKDKKADLDGNGVVDNNDLLLLSTHINQ